MEFSTAKDFHVLLQNVERLLLQYSLLLDRYFFTTYQLHIDLNILLRVNSVKFEAKFVDLTNDKDKC